MKNKKNDFKKIIKASKELDELMKVAQIVIVAGIIIKLLEDDPKKRS